MNTKGLTRTRNFFYLLSIAFILASVVTGFIPPRIAQAGSIWTTNGSSCQDPAAQDTNHYDAGDHVYIRGNGFTPNAAGTFTITGQPGGASNDPQQVVASDGFTTDATGYFCVDAYVVGSEGADDGYVDDGTYSVDVEVGKDKGNDNYTTDAPNPASASVTTGACTYTPAAGSLTLVTINLTGASLSIAGLTFTSSTVISLPPGSYPYTWTALEGYTGSGSGTLFVDTCAPGNASVTLGACSYSQAEGSKTAVIIDVSNAALTIAGNTYSADQTIYLSPGTYP